MSQDVYEAEDRGADVALLDARVGSGTALQHIAVAVAAKQMEQVVLQQAVLEQLEVVEGCILSANTAESQVEVNVLITTADLARSRVEELMKRSAEEGRKTDA
jgi:hypothetical protein